MSTTSPVSGLVIPEDLDILNTESAFGQFAQSVDTQCIPRFTTNAVRDAAITSPTEGMFCAMGSSYPHLVGREAARWSPTGHIITALMTSNVTHNTTATLQDLPGMTFNLDSGFYHVEVVVTVDGTVDASAVDYALVWSYTGSMLTSESTLFALAAATASTTPNITNVKPVAESNTGLGFGTSSVPRVAFVTYSFRPTSSGVLKFQGRQLVAGAEVLTTLAYGTWATLRKAYTAA